MIFLILYFTFDQINHHVQNWNWWCVNSICMWIIIIIIMIIIIIIRVTMTSMMATTKTWNEHSVMYIWIFEHAFQIFLLELCQYWIKYLVQKSCCCYRLNPIHIHSPKSQYLLPNRARTHTPYWLQIDDEHHLTFSKNHIPTLFSISSHVHLLTHSRIH